MQDGKTRDSVINGKNHALKLICTLNFLKKKRSVTVIRKYGT